MSDLDMHPGAQYAAVALESNKALSDLTSRASRTELAENALAACQAELAKARTELSDLSARAAEEATKSTRLAKALTAVSERRDLDAAGASADLAAANEIHEISVKKLAMKEAELVSIRDELAQAKSDLLMFCSNAAEERGGFETELAMMKEMYDKSTSKVAEDTEHISLLEGELASTRRLQDRDAADSAEAISLLQEELAASRKLRATDMARAEADLTAANERAASELAAARSASGSMAERVEAQWASARDDLSASQLQVEQLRCKAQEDIETIRKLEQNLALAGEEQEKASGRAAAALVAAKEDAVAELAVANEAVEVQLGRVAELEETLRGTIARHTAEIDAQCRRLEVLQLRAEVESTKVAMLTEELEARRVEQEAEAREAKEATDSCRAELHAAQQRETNAEEQRKILSTELEADRAETERLKSELEIERASRLKAATRHEATFEEGRAEVGGLKGELAAMGEEVERITSELEFHRGARTAEVVNLEETQAARRCLELELEAAARQRRADTEVIIGLKAEVVTIATNAKHTSDNLNNQRQAAELQAARATRELAALKATFLYRIIGSSRCLGGA